MYEYEHGTNYWLSGLMFENKSEAKWYLNIICELQV